MSVYHVRPFLFPSNYSSTSRICVSAPSVGRRKSSILSNAPDHLEHRSHRIHLPRPSSFSSLSPTSIGSPDPQTVDDDILYAVQLFGQIEIDYFPSNRLCHIRDRARMIRRLRTVTFSQVVQVRYFQPEYYEDASEHQPLYYD